MLVYIIFFEYYILEQETQIIIIPIMAVHNEIIYLKGDHWNRYFIKVIHQGYGYIRNIKLRYTFVKILSLGLIIPFNNRFLEPLFKLSKFLF